VVGADGAQPGVAMPANPTTGTCFRRPFRHFPTAVMIKQTTPLEPKALEYSYHAPGIGLVLTLAVSGGTDRVELVRHSPGK
jgi:hypothetical protein